MPNHQDEQYQEEEEEEMSSYRRFQWYEVLLGLVAAVVAVLAMAVLVKAVMVMRPSAPSLFQIKVIHGAVPVEFQPPPPSSILLYFRLAASNPITNRPSKVSFTSIRITLNNEYYTVPTRFTVNDIVGVMPGDGGYVNSTIESDNPAAVLGDYTFGKLKSGGDTLTDMRLYGKLTTEYLPFNGTVDDDRPAHVPSKIQTYVIYTCPGVLLKLTLGPNDSSNNFGNDVSCIYTSPHYWYKM